MSLHFITRFLPAALIGIGCGLLPLGCETPERRDERLARQYCGSCHAYPEPGLLPKALWAERIMPAMALRMGFESMNQLVQMDEDERNALMRILPDKPMLSEEEFEHIKAYYQRHAPDTLTLPTALVTQPLHQFDAMPYYLPTPPLITMIQADTLHRQLFVGTRLSKVYTLTEDLVKKDSLTLPGPPSAMIVDDHQRIFLSMGIMDPNDATRGQVWVQPDTGTAFGLIDSLQRPVHFQQTDLNADGRQDYLVCAFGNHTGALLAYEGQADGTLKKHVLATGAGARKTILRDFDNNGLPDIAALLTQGDERIILLLNYGQFKFRVTTLLRFPPVYGSSFFELVDFNHDQHPDIVYSNGDNADYSPILKPYHGVRLFLNDGTNRFTESFFLPLHGAFQTSTQDFDRDGDLDIAAISFFPDFREHAEQGFVYYENTGGSFHAYTTSLAAGGRWITMETTDLNHDHYPDLLIGALDFDTGVPRPLIQQWASGKTSLLVLKNTAGLASTSARP
ncbi:VCBS repeat-containing protein [Fulvivirgaceae bacterium PWU5]|uniref:VCBS repeat-containing protein n=1 Tax=Dawidia cretensis TaxID=2782350 RepID=A0AAP2DYR1_9BACT|nr:VCBS repeat-containing protein [Dawidia cretensis]MBT1708532.1 VCBS repeat-containing protein [Dawidia cretensis]